MAMAAVQELRGRTVWQPTMEKAGEGQVAMERARLRDQARKARRTPIPVVGHNEQEAITSARDFLWPSLISESDARVSDYVHDTEALLDSQVPYDGIHSLLDAKWRQSNLGFACICKDVHS